MHYEFNLFYPDSVALNEKPYALYLSRHAVRRKCKRAGEPCIRRVLRAGSPRTGGEERRWTGDVDGGAA